MTVIPFDRRGRSLEQLEDDYWGEPSPHDSYVVRTCEALRRKPLGDLTVEEIRLAIGQPPFLKSLRYLVPLALKHLRVDPMVAATFYEGDLLKCVLSVPPAYWSKHPGQREELNSVIDEFLGRAEPDEGMQYILSFMRPLIEAFRSA